MLAPPATPPGLDWDQPYRTTKSLVIQVTAQGEIVANNSVSRKPQALSPHLFMVLVCFLQGSTPRRAMSRLQEEEWEVEQEAFETVVRRMVRLGFLTPLPTNGHAKKTAAAEVALADGVFASAVSHHVMLRDFQRVLTYKAAIFRHAAGRDVLEIGCGTGILSIFAAQAGARRVVAIEESEIAHVAAQMFEANGLADRIELVRGNSRDITLAEPVDLIIHELIGADPFDENMLVYLDDARRRFLRPGGRFLPGRFEICCVGYEVADDKNRMIEEAGEFSGLYGVKFDPFIEALTATELPRSSRRPAATAPTPMLTGECRLYDIDLAHDAGFDLPEIEARLPVRRQGLMGGIEVFFRAHFDETTQLTNAPFVADTHWHRRRIPFATPLPVNEGEWAPLVVRLDTHLGKQHLAAEPA